MVNKRVILFSIKQMAVAIVDNMDEIKAICDIYDVFDPNRAQTDYYYRRIYDLRKAQSYLVKLLRGEL